MNYQYKLTHFKGDMGHGVASDVVSLLVLMVVSGLFGQPPYQSLCIGQWITTFHDEVVVPWQEGQWHVLWLWVCTIHKFTTRLLPPPLHFLWILLKKLQKKTPNQAQAPPHTTQNSPWSHIAILEMITAPLPSTVTPYDPTLSGYC